MAGAERPRGPLAMDEEAGQYPIDHMLLDLAGVMRDVVEQRKGCLWQDVGENLSDEMRDDLSIGQRAVDRRPHRAEILLSNLRIDRGAGQFTVRQFDMVSRRSRDHALQKLGPDLMTEPS